jgi:quercetin dioxygenase-like cupin family protein
LYLLEGELLVELDGRPWRLGPGDYCLMPVGTWHALANPSASETRWVSVNTPQRLDPTAGRRDTFFRPERLDLAALAAAARPLPRGGPTARLVGHYPGTPPQAEALQVEDPARGRAAAGMDTALLAYSGISVKMLVDARMGADLLTLFSVDYEVGGAAQPHDHPFEETYVFLAGTIEAELEGTLHRLGAGDAVFAGVGSSHAFYNVGPQRVRWIETQAPQPPLRHAYRWLGEWASFDPETAP